MRWRSCGVDALATLQAYCEDVGLGLRWVESFSAATLGKATLVFCGFSIHNSRRVAAPQGSELVN